MSNRTDKQIREELQEAADKAATLIGELKRRGWNVKVNFEVTQNKYHDGGWDMSGGEDYASVNAEKKVSL